MKIIFTLSGIIISLVLLIASNISKINSQRKRLSALSRKIEKYSADDVEHERILKIWTDKDTANLAMIKLHERNWQQMGFLIYLSQTVPTKEKLSILRETYDSISENTILGGADNDK